MPITFQLLLTLVSSSNAENAETLWGFIGRYRPGVTPQTHPKLDAMVGYAINYFRDSCCRRRNSASRPTASARRCTDLRDALSQSAAGCDGRGDPGRGLRDRPPRAVPRHEEAAKDGRPGVSLDWFNMLYQVLLGQEKGPRFGSFVAVYGVENTVDMIDGALARSA